MVSTMKQFVSRDILEYQLRMQKCYVHGSKLKMNLLVRKFVVNMRNLVMNVDLIEIGHQLTKSVKMFHTRMIQYATQFPVIAAEALTI